MGKLNKKASKQKAANQRRQAEDERLRQAIARQIMEMASRVPKEEQAPSKKDEEQEPAETDEELKERLLMNRFERAKTPEKIRMLFEALEKNDLNDDTAFDMLDSLYDDANLKDQSQRAQLRQILARLRADAPAIYASEAAFYNQMLVNLAVLDGDWAVIPDLLAEFEREPDPPVVDMTIELLDFHGKQGLYLPFLKRVLPEWEKDPELAEWVIADWTDKLFMALIFDHLENSPQPEAPTADLKNALRFAGQLIEGWLETFLTAMTAAQPAPRQLSEFGTDIDDKEWSVSVFRLLLDLMAERKRAGVPYSRTYLAVVNLQGILEQQFGGPAPRKKKPAKKGQTGRRDEISSTLIPDSPMLDEVFGELLNFLEPKPYLAAALAEMLPAYLHFIARFGLIHPVQLDAALADLSDLFEKLPPVLESNGADPLTIQIVEEAWSSTALEAIRNDPALAEARAQPMILPVAEEPMPRAKPGALLTYTFQVTYLPEREIWRKIELPDTSTLHDLHEAIQDAVNFDDDHLYSFFMSNRAWDNKTAYVHPQDQDGKKANRVKLRFLELRLHQRFLYLFDYGDEHRFEVKLVGVNPDAPKADYPLIVEAHGEDPVQYPDWDEEDDEDEGEDWDEDEEEEGGES